MKYKKSIFNILILLLITFPLLFWIMWKFSPRTNLSVFIMDKSSSSSAEEEHRALNWVLNNSKITKADHRNYSISEDYFGFFPFENSTYKINDLRKYTTKQIDSLSNLYDIAYYADTYGIDVEEWSGKIPTIKFSQNFYGGLEEEDLLFLKKMKEKKKLIIEEFNFFSKPTPDKIRYEAENLFGLKWTGWSGRYFNTLDTTSNSDLPHWVIKLYKEQNNGKWSFKKSGIVFVNDDNQKIVILEDETHITYKAPLIFTPKYGQDKFSVPYEIPYSYWFDITYPLDTSAKIVSYYKIETNKKGDSLLAYYKIPRVFPAVIENENERFYYFCGDFCDAPINMNLAEFKGIRFFERTFNRRNSINNRQSFFWYFYQPMMEKILSDNINSRKN